MALRSDPRLRPETRQRILAAALRTGYRQNAIAQALTRRRSRAQRDGKTPRIAYIANRSPENGFYKRVFVRLLLRGAREKALALGYDFEVLFLDRGHHDSQSLYRYLTQHGIHGVIIGSLEPERAGVELEWSEFCVVQFDSRHLQSSFTFVSNDQFHAARLAFQRLRMLGYRRIGLALGAGDNAMTANLHAGGYLLEQIGLGRADRIEPCFLTADSSLRQNAARLADWIETHEVDAVICNWTGIRRLIQLGGLTCPSQVGCACTCLHQATPRVAGIVYNLELVGAELTNRLAGLLQSEDYGVPAVPSSTYVEGAWHDGTSAPARR